MKRRRCRDEPQCLASKEKKDKRKRKHNKGLETHTMDLMKEDFSKLVFCFLFFSSCVQRRTQVTQCMCVSQKHMPQNNILIYSVWIILAVKNINCYWDKNLNWKNYFNKTVQRRNRQMLMFQYLSYLLYFCLVLLVGGHHCVISKRRNIMLLFIQGPNVKGDLQNKSTGNWHSDWIFTCPFW